MTLVLPYFISWVIVGYCIYGLGFIHPDASAITSAAVTAIYSNYSTDFLNGTADPDVVIPKMRGELEAAGIDELIADIQSEPDAHLAAAK